jgi:inhibitor of KinA
MRIEPLGDSALLVRVAEEFAATDTLEAVARAARQLALAQIPGVIELVPAYTTIGVFLEPTDAGTFHELRTRIERAMERNVDTAPARLDPIIDVPVCYEDEFAPDLEAVAQHTGFAPEEVVRRHSDAVYRVGCVGFTPGFPYLSGLPPELATPRRPSPRKEVPAGAVAIGGTQTGIYPRRSPGGWNIIGRTSLRLFDVERHPPALFQAGDRVRFRKISREEFEMALRA